MTQNSQGGPSSIHFDRNYVNCPTCGRSIEMSELAADAMARQEAIRNMLPEAQAAINNSMQPIPSCKVCKSKMQQAMHGALTSGTYRRS